MTVFLAVADAGSFSGGARRLEMSAPTVTRSVAALERRLGALLLVRTTRSLRLTEAGQRYAADCRRILEDVERADDAAAGAMAVPRGALAITAPALFGELHVMPAVLGYLRAHRQVSVRALLVDRVVNLMDEDIDVAVRIGALPDSSLTAVPVGHVRRVVCAAPAYLARHGVPQTPADLRRHNCLSFVLGETLHDRWTFEHDGTSLTIPVKGDRVGDDGDLVRRWALAGHGVAYKSRYDVLTDLRAGRLVELLTGYVSEPSPLYLLCVHRMLLSPAVRRLREFLQERFKAFEAG